MNTLKRHFSRLAGRIGAFVTSVWTGFKRAINRFPLFSFMLALLLLLGLAFAGNILRQPETDGEVAAAEPKVTEVYALGSNPEITVQAKVEKSGIIKLTALSGGVVQKIRVTEGGAVKRGTQVFSLSSNYQGGNILSLSRQISQKNYQAAVDNYPLQKDSIAKSRELAEKSEGQASELREIARKSIDETKSLIALNTEVIDGLNRQITALEKSNLNGVNDAALLQLKSTKAQVQGGVNGLNSSLRNTEYLNSDDQEPAQIARISKENTLRQLELQERALDLSKELSLLNLRISQVNESLMYPASPCPGVVERIHVKVGQSVAPGTLLATIRATDNDAQAVALVSSEIARSLSPYQASSVTIGDQTVEVTPRYIAQEPTDGILHAVTFTLPEKLAPSLSNGSFVEMTLPLTGGLTAITNTYVPLDSVYQSQTGAYVFVVNKSTSPATAQSKTVKLGSIFGRFVEVTEGLQIGDEVILNRSILDGDAVSTQ